MFWQRPWRALERFLRIHRLQSGWAVFQARAIYAVALGFGVLQLINVFLSYYTYGGWTPYLLPSIAFVVLAVPIALSLRWTRSTTPLTIILASLMLVGIGLPAMADNTGIDTSLLPYLAVSPLVLSFIGGWRSALVFFPAAAALLFALAENSVPGQPGFLVGLTMDQELRLTQALSALGVATFAACSLSAAAKAALDRLEKAREKANTAEASKTQFLAAMSHELRTPMNAVLGLTGVILNDERGELSPRHRDLLQTVDVAGRQLLSVVDDILNISKLEADMMEIQNEPFDFRVLVRNLFDTFSANAEVKRLELKLAIAEEVPATVNGDDLRLRQILSNLLSNAIKFTDEGCIIVRAGVMPGRQEWIWMEVEDTGCGVPAERSEAIFNPFQQAESGSVRSHGGTGLGLAISRRLAELMGGEINIKKTSAEGTTFVLMLPLPEADATSEAPEPESSQETERLDGLKVLVVEDNAVNRLVIGEILQMLGATTRFAENGLEALVALPAYDVDVVLMDKHMPEMDGLEATKAIRESGEAWADIPIIAATADAMAGEEAAMLAAGMDGFVSKPVRASQLASTISTVLDRKPAELTDDQSFGNT